MYPNCHLSKLTTNRTLRPYYKTILKILEHSFYSSYHNSVLETMEYTPSKTFKVFTHKYTFSYITVANAL